MEVEAMEEEKPTPLEFLEAVYLEEEFPITIRLKAASEAAKYRHAQLRAVAIGHMDQNSFAAALERAILRSQSSYMPRQALPAPEQHPASELKGNFPMRRRNLR
jgi:hypothetical protein